MSIHTSVAVFEGIHFLKKWWGLKESTFFLNRNPISPKGFGLSRKKKALQFGGFGNLQLGEFSTQSCDTRKKHGLELQLSAGLFFLVVVSNIFYFHPYLGKMNPFWPAYFSNGLKPPTSFVCLGSHGCFFNVLSDESFNTLQLWISSKQFLEFRFIGMVWDGWYTSILHHYGAIAVFKTESLG